MRILLCLCFFSQLSFAADQADDSKLKAQKEISDLLHAFCHDEFATRQAATYRLSSILRSEHKELLRDMAMELRDAYECVEQRARTEALIKEYLENLYARIPYCEKATGQPKRHVETSVIYEGENTPYLLKRSSVTGGTCADVKQAMQKESEEFKNERMALLADAGDLISFEPDTDEELDTRLNCCKLSSVGPLATDTLFVMQYFQPPAEDVVNP